MTKEEAIGELKTLKENYWDDDGYGHETEQYNDAMLALDMAIKALEQQPCEDTISRQAVLDGLASIAKAKAKSDAQKSLMGRVMFFVEQLPPVTPKPKTGHWIRMKAYEKWGCSECNAVFRFTFKEHNYCPNCGCKMEVEE